MNTVTQIAVGVVGSITFWVAFTYLVQPAIERRGAEQREKRRAKYRWMHGHDPDPPSAASSRIVGVIVAVAAITMLVSAVSLERWFMASSVAILSLLQVLTMIRKARNP